MFLNKSYLNILNSFKKNKIRNKGFKPLYNFNTYTKYFIFFKLFFVFILFIFFIHPNKFYPNFKDLNTKIKELLSKAYNFN